MTKICKKTSMRTFDWRTGHAHAPRSLFRLFMIFALWVSMITLEFLWAKRSIHPTDDRVIEEPNPPESWLVNWPYHLCWFYKHVTVSMAHVCWWFLSQTQYGQVQHMALLIGSGLKHPVAVDWHWMIGGSSLRHQRWARRSWEEGAAWIPDMTGDISVINSWL